jgi:hypothetical protein
MKNLDEQAQAAYEAYATALGIDKTPEYVPGPVRAG